MNIALMAESLADIANDTTLQQCNLYYHFHWRKVLEEVWEPIGDGEVEILRNRSKWRSGTVSFDSIQDAFDWFQEFLAGQEYETCFCLLVCFTFYNHYLFLQASILNPTKGLYYTCVFWVNGHIVMNGMGPHPEYPH